jgi:uroporphyrinogen decarboxylase
VDLIQIFDTWAGVLAPAEFNAWCLVPLAKIIAGVRAKFPQVPIIAFPRGIGLQIKNFSEAMDADVVGLDTSMDLAQAIKACGPKTVFQGNLDPLALLAGGAALERAVRDIMAATQGRAHVFNLGHGILPETPVGHVEHLLRLIRTNS